MNDPIKKELFTEIVSTVGDFYKTQACDFIKGLPQKEAWYDLPASQVKRLQDTFAQADEESAQKNTNRHKMRKDKLEKFLRGTNERREGQAEKERRKGAEPLWQTLVESPQNLSTFLFPESEKFFADLRNHVEKLAGLRGQQYPDSQDIQNHLTLTADQKSEFYHWQRHELLPLITEKLLHTLITLHRLHNAECYKERKDWLPC